MRRQFNTQFFVENSNLSLPVEQGRNNGTENIYEGKIVSKSDTSEINVLTNSGIKVYHNTQYYGSGFTNNIVSKITGQTNKDRAHNLILGLVKKHF